MNRTLKFLTTFFFTLFCVFVYGLHLNALKEIEDAERNKFEHCKMRLEDCLKTASLHEESSLKDSYVDFCKARGELCMTMH